MNDEQKAKIERVRKLKMESAGTEKSNAKLELHMFGTDDVKMIHEKFMILHEEVSEVIRNQELDKPTREVLQDLKKEINDLGEQFKKGLSVTNHPDKVTVSNLKDLKFPEIKAPQPIVKVLKEEDLFSVFKAADADQREDSESYYGFVDAGGKWFVMREMGKEKKSWRYASSKLSYNRGWANRKSLDYVYFYELKI